MDITIAMKFAWQLAASEAVNSGFGEIHPENFLVSLLKLSELDSRQLQKAGCAGVDEREISSEIAAMRGSIQANDINSTVVRRNLRGLLGCGYENYSGGIIHRSNDARKYFEKAIEEANKQGEEQLSAIRLLHVFFAFPTTKTIEALAGNYSEMSENEPDTPLLKKWGKEFPEQTRVSENKDNSVCPPEVKVLEKILQENQHRGIFLVAEYPQLARAVVSAVAGTRKTQGKIIQNRFIDISTIFDAVSEKNIASTVSLVMEEIDSLRDSAIYLSLIKTGAEQGVFTDVLKILHNQSASRVMWVCGISESLYKKEIAGIISWKRVTRTIWLSPKQASDLPDKF